MKIINNYTKEIITVEIKRITGRTVPVLVNALTGVEVDSIFLDFHHIISLSVLERACLPYTDKELSDRVSL
jgi:hypothetical protein